MDTNHGLAIAAANEPGIGLARTARLVCLGRPCVEPVWPAPGFDPLNGSREAGFLLRVVAAGLPGAPVAPLRVGSRRSSAPTTGRAAPPRDRLAALLGTRRSPIQVVGGIAKIDHHVLEVDSLQLEEDLAPLLDPFGTPSDEQIGAARARLRTALAGHSIFLPSVNTDWARAARFRIADAMARAARRLASE